MPSAKAFNSSKLNQTIAVVYIVAMSCYIPIAGSFLLCDILVPFMFLAMLNWWHNTKTIMVREGITLTLLLVWATGVTFVHCLQNTGTFHELIVYMYVIFIFLFFRQLDLYRECRLLAGLSLLGFALLAWVIGGFLDSSVLFYHDPGINLHTSNLLARRFQFLTGNPNLLAPYYAMIAALMSPIITETFDQKYSVKRWLFLGAITILLLLPLASTMSKHALLTFAIIAGSLAKSQRVRASRLWRCCLYLPLVAFALLCLTSTIVQTFPLKDKFPYINCDTISNYAIHHRIYSKIITKNPFTLIYGQGQTRLQELYPQYADTDFITQVLSHYQALEFVETYANYMDPHNEYLNIVTLFGIPALMLAIAFLFMQGVRAGCEKNYPLLFFILALLVCCYWDDLFSKRFIWVTMALLLPYNH